MKLLKVLLNMLLTLWSLVTSLFKKSETTVNKSVKKSLLKHPKPLRPEPTGVRLKKQRKRSMRKSKFYSAMYGMNHQDYLASRVKCFGTFTPRTRFKVNHKVVETTIPDDDVEKLIPRRKAA